MPQKRPRRRRRSKRSLPEEFYRRRLGEDGVSLPRSSVDSDSSSTTSPVDGRSPPPGLSDEPVMSSTEPSYYQIIASRLDRLELPAVDNDNPDSAHLPKLPSSEIFEALTRKSFHDDDLRAALVELQCRKFQGEPQGSDIQGQDRDSGESDSEPSDVIPKDEYAGYRQVLGDRMTPVDTYTKLDQEQTNVFHLKRALYRIKAALLLKGKPVDELDDAALERKYPPELIVENDYFFHYVNDGYFGWYFDCELCYKKSLSDYQRLVLLNDGDEFTYWSEYRELYCTPEADRDYLKYWETLLKKMKWLEQYLLKDVSRYEWSKIHAKAMFQAARIAVKLSYMTTELAAIGLHEYIWVTKITLLFLKYLDGIYYVIWSRMNEDPQLSFRDALKKVYDDELFPAHNRSMKNELENRSCTLEQLFGPCTKGLSKNLPEHKARELISQEILWRREMQGSYERYARKKLKIAELIGLIPKEDKAAA